MIDAFQNTCTKYFLIKTNKPKSYWLEWVSSLQPKPHFHKIHGMQEFPILFSPHDILVYVTFVGKKSPGAWRFDEA